ncbi:hypothetical protein BDV12DRAFT_167944 [Aspergillus spectabilis]
MGRLPDIESDTDSYNGQSQRQFWTGTIIWCAIAYTCMLAIFMSVCFPDFSLLKLGFLPLLAHGSSPACFYAFSKSPKTFSKPKSIEIVALVPFHQAHRTEILDCYLRRNLVSSGGFLDRVVFLPQTNDTESLEWLTSTVERTSTYLISETTGSLFDVVSGVVNTLFLWIDGNVVFIEGQTIPTMVKTKLDHPNSLIVSANVINQAALERLHSHPSIALPYLPELQPAQSIEHDSWRASDLPPWKRPTEFHFRRGFSQLSENHRWLPSGDEGFYHTPIGMSVYSDDGPNLEDWTVKAQQHYSFLHHLELDELNRYKFPIWTNPTEPISTAFFFFASTDAETAEAFLQRNGSHTKVLKATENEDQRTKDVIIDGKGIAAHYSSEHGSRGLDDTDLLQRYRSYAREMVCPEIT